MITHADKFKTNLKSENINFIYTSYDQNYDKINEK